MSRFIESSGTRFFGSRAILRLFIAGTAAGSMEESPRTSPRAPFVAEKPNRAAERLDSVAGSEFVDDRIRLRD